jgi:hypothetical protein
MIDKQITGFYQAIGSQEEIEQEIGVLTRSAGIDRQIISETAGIGYAPVEAVPQPAPVEDLQVTKETEGGE